MNTPENIVLHNQWLDLCQRLGAKNPEVVWEWLEAAYNESHRHYHTLNHIAHCLDELHSLEKKYPPEVELAIWFHDIVYDTMSHDNEEKSADIVTNAVGVMQLPNGFLSIMKPMILESKHSGNKHCTEETNVFLDVDLSILGQSSAAFEEYEQQIRAEYAWVPFLDYCAARINVLKRFLDRPTIYKSMEIRNKYEQQARENIRNSIHTLSTKRYLGLLEKCNNETSFYSDLSMVKKNFNYSLMLTMGKDIVPVIFEQLQKDTSWVHILLLTDLLGPIDIPLEAQGRIDMIAQLWLEQVPAAIPASVAQAMVDAEQLLKKHSGG